jgi:hypothetical protein
VQVAYVVVELLQVPPYIVFVVPPSLIGLAAVLAVVRAKKDDLPAIVRALMRVGPRDGGRDDPPSLPEA